jgi:hypothetical protein
VPEARRADHGSLVLGFLSTLLGIGGTLVQSLARLAVSHALRFAARFDSLQMVVGNRVRAVVVDASWPIAARLALQPKVVCTPLAWNTVDVRLDGQDLPPAFKVPPAPRQVPTAVYFHAFGSLSTLDVPPQELVAVKQLFSPALAMP